LRKAIDKIEGVKRGPNCRLFYKKKNKHEQEKEEEEKIVIGGDWSHLGRGEEKKKGGVESRRALLLTQDVY